MKRFAIFCGSYNSLMMGGAKDFKESVHTEEQALERVKEIAKPEAFLDWIQIFDKKTDKARNFKFYRGELKEQEPDECERPSKKLIAAAEPQYA
ncbi:hypothetical protein MJO52_03030 [Microbulbifer variabilis]|uniref:Uncharacterized protein n=1 Tax=Microbulbifer variabilis TaxID=266805 RepID=A0ABY4VCW3_9GAMM|nr:hypothetical protein [Microbulbifer variabilis]USD22123.1 hypothetical protein MJO52_03030 [Microbulbifer variabilis]